MTAPRWSCRVRRHAGRSRAACRCSRISIGASQRSSRSDLMPPCGSASATRRAAGCGRSLSRLASWTRGCSPSGVRSGSSEWWSFRNHPAALSAAPRGNPRVFLVFDNDEAGLEATERLAGLLGRRAVAVTDALSQPLDPALVSQRKGRGGRTFDYLESHIVIDQDNRIFGFGGRGAELVGDVSLRRIETVDTRTGEVTSPTPTAPRSRSPSRAGCAPPCRGRLEGTGRPGGGRGRKAGGGRRQQAPGEAVAGLAPYLIRGRLTPSEVGAGHGVGVSLHLAARAKRHAIARDHRPDRWHLRDAAVLEHAAGPSECSRAGPRRWHCPHSQGTSEAQTGEEDNANGRGEGRMPPRLRFMGDRLSTCGLHLLPNIW